MLEFDFECPRKGNNPTKKKVAGGADAIAGASGDGAAGAQGPAASGSGGAAGAEAGGGAGDPQTPPTKPKPTPKPKDPASKEFGILVREAAKVKTMFSSTTTTCMQLCQAIASDDDWEWAKGGCKERELKAAQETLKESLSPWAKDYLMATDFAEFRKRFTTEKVTVELRGFIENRPAIERLSELCASLARAHQALSSR